MYFNIWTWILVLMMWPFLPSKHAWKKERSGPFTLRDWSDGCTLFTNVNDLFYWSHMFLFVYLWNEGILERAINEIMQ